MAKKETENMTEAELVALCDQEFDDAQVLTTEIQSERQDALNYYDQELFGNEEDGLSKYVSSDVRDAVEWIMPQLIDIFVGGDTPVVFEGENADDVKAAEIESRYCQYVFERQNEGVILMSVWLKDALLQKNGIIKVFREKEVKREREEYEGKTSAEYLALSADDEFEISEATITVNEKEYSLEEYEKVIKSLPTQAGAIDAEATFNIVGYRKKTVSGTKIENVPPEQFFMRKDHNSIFAKDSSFCGEFYEKTRSELMEMGYPKDLVDSLPASIGVSENMTTNERQTRRKKEGGVTQTNNNAGKDRSRELVMIYDFYIRADFNNDGFAELRHVRTAGRGGGATVLDNDEVDRNIYHAITPYLNSYRFYGRSVADNLMDIQRAKSQLWRNAFDNVAYSSIPRKIVKGNVDTAALMTYVQGGIIKADMNAEVLNEVTPFVADSALAMCDKVDMIRAERSGFSKDTMGLNPEALANATNPVGMSILAQSQLLTKMIATIIANSGFKSMMEHIRELVMKYESKAKIFDLTGEILESDPRQWRKERSSSVKVGIGYAGKQEEISVLNNLLVLQEKFIVAQGGQINGILTNAQGIFNTVQKLCRRMGVKDAKTYFQNPAEYEAPPPQPTIAEKTLQLQQENINAQTKVQDAKVLQDNNKIKNDAEYKKAELEQKERLTMKEIESREYLAEKELIYKYGKDAHDNSRAVLEALSIKRKEREDEKKAQEEEDSKDESGEILVSIASEIGEGMKKAADAQVAGSKEIVKHLSKKKKLKITRDAKNKIQQVEEE